MLLAFAGLLCLFGLAMLIDGIKRLIVEWRQGHEAAVSSQKEQKETLSTSKRAA